MQILIWLTLHFWNIRQNDLSNNLLNVVNKDPKWQRIVTSLPHSGGFTKLNSFLLAHLVINRNRIGSNVRCSISQILRKNERFASSSSPFGHRWIWGEQPLLWVHHPADGPFPSWTKRVATQIGCCPLKHVAKIKRERKIKRFTLLAQIDLLLYSLIFFYLYGSNHWSSSDFIILCRLNFEFHTVPLDKPPNLGLNWRVLCPNGFLQNSCANISKKGVKHGSRIKFLSTEGNISTICMKKKSNAYCTGSHTNIIQ